MMKYVILIPTSSLGTSFATSQVPFRKTATWMGNSVIESPTAKFYPLHKSLEDEINRLFAGTHNLHWVGTPAKQENDIMEEFKHNGKDTEYLPPEEEDVPKPNVPRRRKNKKPLPTECVFCKNNGETTKLYTGHILKDAEGNIICPILRNYECPICHAKGDKSHTLKYCPENTHPQTVPMANSLKGLRNATGKRRSK